MAHKGTTLVVSKDHLPPQDFVEKVLKENPAPFGFACVQDGEILWQQEQDGLPIDQIMGMLDEYKSSDRVVYFGNYPQGFDEEDLQPYLIQADNDDNPVILAFMDGDFSSFAQAGSSRSDQYFAKENVILPRITQFYELTEGDVAKVMFQMGKQNIEDEFLNAAIGRGIITLVASTGDIRTFQKGYEEAAKVPWGWASNAYASEYPEKTEVVEAPKGKGNLGSRLKFKTKAEPAPKETIGPVSPEGVARGATKVSKVGETTILHKEDIKSTTATLPLVKVRVPTDLTNKQIKQWLNKALGHIPAQWRPLRGQLVEVTPAVAASLAGDGKVLKDLSDLKDVKIVEEPEKAPLIVAPEPAKEVVEPPFKKDTETHNLGTSPLIKPSTVPLIPLAQLKAFKETFMKSTEIAKAREASPPTTLEEIAALEKRIPNFTEQTGHQLEEIFTWPHTAFDVLARDYHQLTAVLCQNLRNELMKLYLASSKATTVVKEDTAPKSKLKFNSEKQQARM